MRYLIYLLMIIPLRSFSQSDFNTAHGTYIISVICNDGIVVCSDSRVCISIPPKASFDSMPKIFHYQDLIIAVAGTYYFEATNITLYGLFNLFKSANKKKLDIFSFYDAFMKFSKNKLADSSYSLLVENKIIVSGYKNDIPWVILYYKNIVEKISSFGYKANRLSDNEGVNYNKFATFINSKKCDSAFKIITDEVKFIIKNLNLNSHSFVGEPVFISYVKKNGHPIWREKPAAKTYNTITESNIAWLSNKRKVWYRSSADSIIGIQQLKGYIIAHPLKK